MQNNARVEYAQFGRYFTRIREDIEKKPIIRVSLELLLTLLAISFFAAFAIRPTANTIADLLANIRSQQEVKQKLDEKISNLSKARQIWNQEEKRIIILEEAMPKEPQPDKYLRQVEGLAALSGVQLVSYAAEESDLYGKPGKKSQDDVKKDKSALQKKRIALSLQGSYKNLSTFLENLEVMRKIIIIESVSLDQARASGSKTDLTLKLIGETPFKNN